MEGYNARGIELLCDVVRGQVASLPCPACGRALEDVRIEVEEFDVDHVNLQLTCGACEKSVRAVVAPVEEGGVAVVR